MGPLSHVVGISAGIATSVFGLSVSAQKDQFWNGIIADPDDRVLVRSLAELASRVLVDSEYKVALLRRPSSCRILPGALDNIPGQAPQVFA